MEEVDIQKLPPPTEEEVRWVERWADDDDGFPGQGGIVAYRMRLRAEAAERVARFPRARLQLHRRLRPRTAETKAA